MDKERLEEVKANIEIVTDYLAYIGVKDFNWLISTVEEQQQRIGALETANDLLYDETLEQQKEIEWIKLQRSTVEEIIRHSESKDIEIKQLREALEFYADEENWWTYPVPGGYASAASVDKGLRARLAKE